MTKNSEDFTPFHVRSQRELDLLQKLGDQLEGYTMEEARYALQALTSLDTFQRYLQAIARACPCDECEAERAKGASATFGEFSAMLTSGDVS